MLRKIACLIPAQLCFILHHLSWWKLLFAVGNFQVTLKLWFTDAWYTHISKFAVLVETKQCLCVSLFVMQEMEERIQHFETFLWDGEKTCQVDPEQLGTTKTHTNWERKSEGASESGPPTKKKNPQREKSSAPCFAGREHDKDEVEDRDIQWCYRLRNLARSRPILQNQTSGGVSVTLAHTHQRWRATLVLLGCLLLSMLL